MRKLLSSAVLATSVVVSPESLALSPEGEAGKKQFAVCSACHNPVLTPPLAPPMWGVQRRYKKLSHGKAQFITLVASYAKAPSEEKAVFSHAVQALGLMPPVTLPESQLRNIASYIWEEQFAPPCVHWKYGAARAQEAGDVAHARKHRRKIERFCNP